MCIGPTSRHRLRSTVVENSSAALLHDLPVRAQDVEAPRGGRAEREQAAAEAPRRPRSGRGHLGGDGHFRERALVGAQLQPSLDELEPVRLHGHRLAGQEQQDRFERLFHHVALLRRVDAHHESVGGQRTRSDAEHHAPARQVVEEHHAVRQHERVVVGQRRDAGAEPDVLRARRGGRDEDLRRGDDLIARRVVFAEPGFVEAERVEVLNQLEVPLEGQRRVLTYRVERRQEDPELEAAVGVTACHGLRSPGWSSVRVIGLCHRSVSSVWSSVCVIAHGVTRILPCSPGVRSVSKAPGAPARPTVDVTRSSAPGTPSARRLRVAANSAGV